MAHYRNRTVIAFMAAALSVTLLGCPMPGQPTPNIEYFRFTYKIAHRQPGGLYRVPWRAADGTCNGSLDLPQAQIVQWVQTGNSGMLDCVSDYTVTVKDNRQLGIVSVRVHGTPSTNQSDIQIRAGRAIVPGTFSEPTNMFLEGTGPIVPGPLPGFTELNFGASGPIFTSNRGTNSFFDYQLFSIDLNNRRVSGSFHFLASNMNDPSDDRLLIAVDSGFLMDID